jgi:hypothetical protein
MPRFADLALPLIRKGFRVIPHGLVDPTRKPLGDCWPERASSDRQQIELWSREYSSNPGVGVGIVVGDDTHWALDVDEPEWVPKYPRTAVVASGGGGRHIYFKHDAYSRRVLKPLGNKYVVGLIRDKAVELCVRNHALLAPGNVHQKTGVEYRWMRETRPAVAAKKFVDFVASLPWWEGERRTSASSTIASGLWTDDALVACLTAMGIEYEEAGNGKLNVLCPGNTADGWFDNKATHSRPTGELDSKSSMWVFNGWPAFKCYRCEGRNHRDLFRHYDPLDSLFNIDRWLDQRLRQVEKEFKRGK